VELEKSDSTEMSLVLTLILAMQFVLLCVMGWFMYRTSQSATWKTAFSPQRGCGSPADTRKVRDLLAAAGEVLAEHASELDLFEKSLDGQATPGDCLHSSALNQRVEQMRRSNRDVEKTVDSTIEGLIATCGDLLAAEQSHLEAYQERTGTFDSTLEGLSREDLLVGIAGKLLDMVHELRFENRAIRDEVTAARDQAVELMGRAHTAEQNARIDPLTRLPNRRAFDEAHAECSDLLEGSGQPYCFLLVDIDHFKVVNDQSGHAAGDAALSMIAQILRDACRTSDHVCRLGGDEFGVLLPRCKKKLARLVAEHCRRKVESATLHYGDLKLSVTISVGVAQASLGETRSRLLERADSALYAAKMHDRNQVCVDPDNVAKDASDVDQALDRRPRSDEAAAEAERLIAVEATSATITVP
jgi:diguanylate cyclase (GGDEF)-like protein